MTTADLLIVWFSRTGASEQLSLAAFAAASETTSEADTEAPPLVPVRRVRCDQANVSDVLGAKAYLFVAPENLGSLAGAMKDFFDRCYYPVLGAIAGRPYAVIISAGSDGQGAVRELTRIATGWRLRLVAPPLIVNLSAQTAEQILAPKQVPVPQLQRAKEIGELLAQGLRLGIW